MKHNDYIIDKDSQFVKLPAGKAKDIILKVEPSGKAVLRFIEYKKVTDNHLDEAGVISNIIFNNFRSLKSLQRTIDRAVNEYEINELYHKK